MILLIFSQNIIYSADTIKYYPDKEILYLINNAEAIYGNLRVTADSLIYFVKEKRLVAISRPILYENEREIKANKMEYYIEEKKGFADDAKTKIEKGYCYGKRTVYLDKNVLKIKNGYFTTCEHEIPHYFFFSPEIKVVLNDRIIARNIILFVKGIPVFYLPFWMYPTVKQRRSGFLIPRIGFSNYGGNFIQNIGWYQTLTGYADATIWFDYYTTTGIWSHLEARYLLKSGSGNLKIDYTKERKGNIRWCVNGSGKNMLPYKINLSYFSDYKSDNKIDIDYYQGETQLQEEANAEINISRTFSFGSISTRIKERRDFIKNISTRELPRIDLNLYGFKIFGLSPNISSYLLRRADGVLYSSSYTVFSFSKTIFPIRSSFGISLRHLYASKTMDSTYYNDIHRSYYIGLRTSMYAISNFGILFVNRFRTVIDPYTNFTLSEKGKTGNLFPGAPFSINPDFSRSLNYGITFTNQWKIKEKVYSPLVLSINGSYIFKDKNFSNLSYSLSVTTDNIFRSRISGYYDISEKKIIMNNITNTLNFQRTFENKPFILNISHSFTFSDTMRNQSATLNSIFYLTKNWNFKINTNYSFKDMKFSTTRITLERNLHCWYFEFSYSQYLTRWDYSFRIGIKEIPEVKLERNTIKGLFP